MMNQEELDPKEVNPTQNEAQPTQEQETAATSEAVKAVEAEDDHEEPKAQKLSIPDVDALSVEECIALIKEHVGQYSPERIKGIVESARSRVLRELNAEREQYKATYLEEGGNIIDFEFDQPKRKELGAIYGQYRDQLRKFYTDLEAELERNLKVKLEIIEEIKSLPIMEGSAKEKYEKFKTLRETWNATGLVPKADARTVWANYNHHVDNFFDFLRLAYDLIDRDYQNNLNEKIAMIEELESLAQGEVNTDLFKTLQKAHSRWKKIGPVPREKKDEIWDRFKAVTAIIHEKRDAYNEALKAQNDQKVAAKRAVVDKIIALNQQTPEKHGGWQKASKALEALRAEFKNIGFVRSEENDEVWEAYKTAQREFNQLKNAFYKEEKKKQREHLDAKKALVTLVEGLKDSDDFAETARAMKKAQADWKKTGYVPKKEGDALWEAFRGACNHFFDRMNGERKAKEQKFSAALKAKEAKLAEVQDLEITSVEAAIALSEEWSALGGGNKKIEDAFNALLEKKLTGLGLSKNDLERTLFEARVKALVEADDQNGLRHERGWLRDQMDSAKKELNQLENNIAFFSSSKGNPLLDAAKANIAAVQARVEHLTSLRKLFNSLLK
ncbi:MAG: DUF349 domain-containing protein [Schleiferiaceae bacterium]